MPSLPGIKKLKEKTSALFGKKAPEEEKFHEDLVRLSTQFNMTGKLIQGNTELLREVSEDENNTGLEEALKNFQSKDLKGIQEKILNREKISQKEAERLISTLEKTTESLSEVGVSLEINLGDLTGDLSGLIQDSRVDRDTRRSIVKEFREFASDQNVSSKALEELKDINLDAANFTQKETKKLDQLFRQIKEDTSDVKISSTLSNLNKSIDSAVLTQSELKDTLAQQTSTKETFGEKFKRIPEAFSQGGQFKTGGVVTGLNAVLPGLGSLTESLGIAEKLGDAATKGIAKIGKGAFGGMKKLKGRIFGSRIKAGEKGIAKAVSVKSVPVQITKTPITDKVSEKKDTLAIKRKILERVKNKVDLVTKAPKEVLTRAKSIVVKTSQKASKFAEKVYKEDIPTISKGALGEVKKLKDKTFGSRLKIDTKGATITKSLKRIPVLVAKASKEALSGVKSTIVKTSQRVPRIMEKAFKRDMPAMRKGITKIPKTIKKTSEKMTKKLRRAIGKIRGRGMLGGMMSKLALPLIAAVGAGVAGLGIGKVIDKFLIKGAHEKYLAKKEKKWLEKHGGPATEEELVKQYGQERVDAMKKKKAERAERKIKESKQERKAEIQEGVFKDIKSKTNITVDSSILKGSKAEKTINKLAGKTIEEKSIVEKQRIAKYGSPDTNKELIKKFGEGRVMEAKGGVMEAKGETGLASKLGIIGNVKGIVESNKKKGSTIARGIIELNQVGAELKALSSNQTKKKAMISIKTPKLDTSGRDLEVRREKNSIQIERLRAEQQQKAVSQRGAPGGQVSQTGAQGGGIDRKLVIDDLGLILLNSDILG